MKKCYSMEGLHGADKEEVGSTIDRNYNLRANQKSTRKVPHNPLAGLSNLYENACYITKKQLKKSMNKYLMTNTNFFSNYFMQVLTQ